jgi:hypothetical protein
MPTLRVGTLRKSEKDKTLKGSSYGYGSGSGG